MKQHKGAIVNMMVS